MNELQAVVNLYAQAQARGERAALATVVCVEGSAYRRPGARMIITENGETCGTISGGCLERDVAERAVEVMKETSTRLIEYDTRGREDIVWGLGLGCNGVVRVLLESLHEGSTGARALQFIADRLHARRSGVVATLITANEGKGSVRCDGTQIGERLMLDERLDLCGQSSFDEALAIRLREEALEVLAGKRAAMRSFETNEGRAEIFFDLISPPRSLLIFGAEQDALPLMRQARTLGWHITVVDTRARLASRERFKDADDVVLCRAAEVAARVSLMEETAAVVMTHNYLDDVELLRALLPSPICYLGILGPRQRTLKLLKEVKANDGATVASEFARLHSPIGIDIGAETPEEIALAITAEIKAVCAARSGGFLRDRNAPIHDEHVVAHALREASVVGATVSAGESAALICHSS